MVFCVDQTHADDMRRALVNANPDLVAADPEWVVRIVGAEEEKARLLEAFSDPESASPVVATTSRLLSTGVDVQDLKYVVLFRPVGSPVEFKQIIGRGTRLYPDKGKTSFEIIDFVGATAHFADPDFDGYPVRIIDDGDGSAELVDGEEDAAGAGDQERPLPDCADDGMPGEVAEPEPPFEPGNPDEPEGDSGDQEPRARYVVDEGSFYVVAEAVQVPDTPTGKLVLTEYGEFVSGQVKRLAPSPAALAERWSQAPGRADVLAVLESAGVDVAELLPPGEVEVDVLDILLQVAWNLPARTRAERARRAVEEHRSDLEARSDTARAVLAALLERYVEEGIDEVTSPEVSLVPPLSELGTPRQLARELGEGGLHGAVDDVQRWVYSTDVVA
ncbi:type I restriction-modification enzyme R subunit C-terminal domain-containing protein [Ornithinibacter aureus]|nr:type I restriction-modification enzyme R subunit C-terminal domain-containing protein [Ornithinibacter aureus]